MTKSAELSHLEEKIVFSENLSWLNKAFNQVKTSFDAQRLPHALLVTAPNQSGKSCLSLHIAQSILCSKTQVSHNTSMAANPSHSLKHGCGQCKSCLLIQSNSHPDVSVVDCLTDSKGKLKKSIGIDQIRDLSNKLAETAQFNGWRIAIIMSVEKMTRGAFNAILKTLEEPGDKTLILMLANSLQQVPATIKSRCQLLHLNLNDNDLTAWLVAETDVNIDIAQQVLFECNNAPFAALDYVKENKSSIFNELRSDLDNVFSNKITPQIFINQYSDLNDELWTQIANYFHKAQLSKLTQSDCIYTKVPNQLIYELYSQLLSYYQGQTSGSNLQMKLQLEAILIQWFEIGRKIVHYSNR